MKRFLVLLLCLLACTTTMAQGQVADSETVYYDGYLWGIHSFEVAITGAEDGTTFIYTVRRKDLEKNQWDEPTSVPESIVAGREEFLFSGSLSSFIASLASLSRVSWSNVEAVGWPNEHTLYVRHQEIRESVGERTEIAYYWGVKDGSIPMDLIIGASDNRVIAAIDVRRGHVIVRRGYENFTDLKGWLDPSISQPLHGYRSLGQVMMPTSKGPRLATRIYLPDGNIEGPFPTVFIRTPYGISGLIDAYFHYAMRGFAVVLQAVGGTAFWDQESLSEGEWHAMVQEPLDGADALNWIVKQPWSNGEICMQGGSYVGYTQWAATIENHPALKCLVPEVSMGTAFGDQPYMGGTFLMGTAFYIFWMNQKPILPQRTWTDIFRHRPIIDIDEYATGE